MPGTTARDLSKRAKDMLDQAMKYPGVAETLKIYEAAAQRTPTPNPPRPAIRFSTGGNA